jgi:hypothetical protein
MGGPGNRVRTPLILVAGLCTPAQIRAAGIEGVTAHLVAHHAWAPGIARTAATAVALANEQQLALPGQDGTAALVKRIAAKLLELDREIKHIDKTIAERFRDHPYARIIESLPGVGPMSLTACLESRLSPGNETVIGMTAILGYARTAGQDLDAQLSALTAAGAERVFTDKLSGSAKTARSGLADMLEYARNGDTLVVTAIDRLGRSVAEVTRTIAELGECGILLRALREGIDTATPTG